MPVLELMDRLSRMDHDIEVRIEHDALVPDGEGHTKPGTVQREVREVRV